MDAGPTSGIAARTEAVAAPGQLPVVVVEVARPGQLGSRRLVVVAEDRFSDWRVAG